ncbi:MULTISPECIES: acyl-CoA thioesterase [unclassified Acinetobacter]|uniref:acyl-CoA thioesterase n=1 Tax=unclassified Acinetobacter TaxID=196816 RepID=UPI0015D1C416|nr:MULTISPECIES: acyl-CoA thioesterase [unclassified Acinetobacter]
MRKYERSKLKNQLDVQWTTEQDYYLIENSTIPLAQLMNVLNFSEDEIHQRKEILGLYRRERQIQRMKIK